MTRPLRVFLCHASQDKPAVWNLYRYLKQHGIAPWLDQADLIPGQNWEVEIPKALFSSDVILVCLSKNSVDKAGYVQKEIAFALDKALEQPEGSIFIIPVKLEECDVPHRLSRYYWVDLFRTDGRKRLLMGLNMRVTELGADVSPVFLDDTRQKRSMPKPSKTTFVPDEQEQEVESFEDKKQEERAVLPPVREEAKREEPQIIPPPAEPAERVPKKITESKARQPKPKVGQVSNVMKPPKQESPARPSQSRNGIPTYAIIGGVMIAFMLLFFGVKSLMNTSTPEIPTEMEIISTPDVGSIFMSDGVTMLYVPAGTFSMGSEISEDEKPIHSVDLDGYYMDKYEVTNAAYKRCVDAGTCAAPKESKSYTRPAYYGNSEFDEFPVIYVDWNMAKTYCEWRDSRLPTEAEWEKAARGTDGRAYPWGEDISCDKLNYNNCKGDTTKVGSYLDGVSPYGLYDMAGNVWEWVSDWYDEKYYQSSPSSNPLGADAGVYRVLRGGAWYDLDDNARSANRYWFDPTDTYDYLGFRCSRSHP